MNNNFENLYYDYIGAIGTHTISDYIDLSSNNNYSYTSNSSNILSNNIINVDNKYKLVYPYDSNSLINIKVDEYLNSNIYIYNPFNLGKIYFKTTNPISSTNIYTKIDFDNKLYVYFPGSILPPKLPEWWCVEEKLSSIFDVNTAQDIAITGLGLAINEVWDSVGLIQGQISQLQLYTLLDTANTRIALAVNSFTLAQQLITGATGVTIAISSFALGMALYINNNYVSTNLLNQITSNTNYTNQEKYNLSNAIIIDQYSNCLKISSNSSNLNILNGFINSNIITQQYIPLLNVDEIKINQTNISNIISSSSNINYIYSSNNSNLLFNNIGISSNNNYIYSSNSIDKINILLPNSSFWYDANFGGIWCYDLNIEKYVKASILPNNYKYRSFRITTYQSKADWRNGYNLYGANIAGDYINFPETLTIHMNNNKQIGAISTADDTYSNGIILGKSKNTNIGYWNILKDNFNYIRYITKVGWDLVCVIEIL